MRIRFLLMMALLLTLMLLSACQEVTVEPETEATGQAPDSLIVYQVVDTGQRTCYDDRTGIECPSEGQAFFGQDAQYAGLQARYEDSGDGTITDLNTGLMWQQAPDLEQKSTFAQAVAGAETFDLAGYEDWRLPSIKELYSLIDFRGSAYALTPYIDTGYFEFRFGAGDATERQIDAQYWSSTEYEGAVFGGQAAVFGVNFADGRIKGYPRDTGRGGSPMTQFVRYVRGNPDYGRNDLIDNGDATINDIATGLMWQKGDSQSALNWQDALAYCEKLVHAGYDDWRLPNAKELQSVVDYTRAPDAQDPSKQGTALDPIFELTEPESWFWSSTTHLDGPNAQYAVYVTFGQAYGVLGGSLVNVHGAGAQRSDPKSGDPGEWASGHGPQNDQIRIYNYARCVRDGKAAFTTDTDGPDQNIQEAPSPSQQGQPGTGGPLNGPPPEAIEACNGAKEGDSCAFSAPHGEVTGTCLRIQDQLACVPQGAPAPQGP